MDLRRDVLCPDLDENELHRLKIALQADDMKVKAGSAGALDNEARTELEASVEKRTAEMEAWKEKQSQSAEWQYANCWTSVYAKLFDRLTPEEPFHLTPNTVSLPLADQPAS